MVAGYGVVADVPMVDNVGMVCNVVNPGGAGTGGVTDGAGTG